VKVVMDDNSCAAPLEKLFFKIMRLEHVPL